MALYAALTVWLLVIMFTAWGVHEIWCRLLKPRVVNAVLLPGTLIAQLGHVVGLLLSGNSVRNLKLMGDDEKGAPKTDPPETPRLPIIGSLLVGLLPLVACAAALYAAARLWGAGILGQADGNGTLNLPQALPTTLAGVWDLLRGSITQVEMLVNAIYASDLPNWPTALFLYVAVCLTVRMAPFEGYRRGALGAVCVAAVVIGVLSSLIPAARDGVLSSWPVLSFAVAVLLLLLLLSLVVRGLVGLVHVLARKG
jgi:hypothetical protein